jgi:hypothetical protein
MAVSLKENKIIKKIFKNSNGTKMIIFVGGCDSTLKAAEETDLLQQIKPIFLRGKSFKISES